MFADNSMFDGGGSLGLNSLAAMEDPHTLALSGRTAVLQGPPIAMPKLLTPPPFPPLYQTFLCALATCMVASPLAQCATRASAAPTAPEATTITTTATTITTTTKHQVPHGAAVVVEPVAATATTTTAPAPPAPLPQPTPQATLAATTARRVAGQAVAKGILQAPAITPSAHLAACQAPSTSSTTATNAAAATPLAVGVASAPP